MHVSRNSRALGMILFVAVVALVSSDVVAQRGGRQRGGRGAGGPQNGGRGGGIQTLLLRSDVRNELDLVDEQIEQLELLAQGRRRGGEEGRNLREEMEGLSDEERREKMRELRQDRENETQSQIEEILLPSQMERLKELAVRFTSQRGGRGLVNGSLAEALGITEDQKEQIEERARELQEEMAKKVAELRAEMQKELFKELTAEQQEKYETLVGEPFEFEQQARERGGAERGQRPGREGQQGGRRNRGDRGGDRGGDRTDF